MFQDCDLKNKNFQQAILAYTDSQAAYKGRLLYMEKFSEKWEIIFECNAVFGKNGMGKEKEGDNKSPVGVFHLTQAFGQADISSLQHFPWFKTDDRDLWVDDPASSDYNQHIRHQGSPGNYWKSYEKLDQPLYKYALVYDYNKNNIPGIGSALFIHLWQSPDCPTAGCTALNEQSLYNILLKLDIKKNPVLIQGSRNDLESISGLKNLLK